MDTDNEDSERRKLPKGVQVLDSSIMDSNRRRFLKAIGATSAAGLAFSGTAVAEDDDDDEEEDDDDDDDEEKDDDETPPGYEQKEESAPEWLQVLVEGTMPREGLNTWVPTNSFDTSSLTRVARFPQQFGNVNKRDLSLLGVRNEQISGQLVVLSNEPIEELSCSVSDLRSGTGNRIQADEIDVRYVGFVPAENALSEFTWSSTFEEITGDILGTRGPDLVGDPLIETNSIPVPKYQAQPIWFTFDIPKNTPPGTYEGTITVNAGKQGTIEYTLEVTVYDVTLPNPEEYEFYLDVWMNPYAIAAEHSPAQGSSDLEPWSSRHWKLIKSYMRDMAKRGQKPILTTIIHEPWQKDWLENTWRPQTQTGYESMVKWQYDGQEWSFDFSLFDKFVETGKKQGLGPDISAYSMLTFRGQQRITYFDERKGEQVVWKGEAGDSFWREAWTAFIDAFKPHLKQKGWLEQTYIAFDERPKELMQEVTSLLKDTAPMFLNKFYVAGSMDVAPLAENLAANYAHVPIDQDVVERRRDNGKKTSFYTSGGHAHPNTLSFSPPAEARMLPWISSLNNLDGYLRWAHNSWPHDVYQDPVFQYVQGDEYFVYPGEDGPVSSLSWEQLTEGIEDYELVHMLRQKSGENTKALEEALELATRDRDAREKDLHDIVRAKKMVLEELTKI